MKIQTIEIDTAINLVSSATSICRVNVAHYTKMKADEKETWITENRKTAWFGSSYKRWENKWYSFCAYHTMANINNNWFTARLNKLETLLIKLESLKAQGILNVTFEEYEINLINISGAA